MMISTFLPSILLIWIPVFFAGVLGLISLPLGNLFYKRFEPGVFYFISAGILGIALCVGLFLGLIFAIFINRTVFDYQILSTVLPSGVILWYGFGPWFTPQFLSFLEDSLVIVSVIAVVFLYLNQRRLRWKDASLN